MLFYCFADEYSRQWPPHPHEEEKDKAQGKESGIVGVCDVKDLCMGSFSLNLERYADGFDVGNCMHTSFLWDILGGGVGERYKQL